MTQYGSFQVSADHASVEELASVLAQASGVPWDGNRVPTTFPILWLTSPQVREALGWTQRQNGEAAILHEVQEFEYVEPLAVDARYILHVQVSRETRPSSRIVIAARIDDLHGRRIGTMRTSLLMVPFNGEGAGGGQ
jgi:hypothetical protein